MPKRKKIYYHDDEFPDICSTASCCECTGLMPSPPASQAEDASYRALFTTQISQSEDLPFFSPPLSDRAE